MSNGFIWLLSIIFGLFVADVSNTIIFVVIAVFITIKVAMILQGASEIIKNESPGILAYSRQIRAFETMESICQQSYTLKHKILAKHNRLISLGFTYLGVLDNQDPTLDYRYSFIYSNKTTKATVAVLFSQKNEADIFTSVTYYMPNNETFGVVDRVVVNPLGSPLHIDTLMYFGPTTAELVNYAQLVHQHRHSHKPCELFENIDQFVSKQNQHHPLFVKSLIDKKIIEEDASTDQRHYLTEAGAVAMAFKLLPGVRHVLMLAQACISYGLPLMANISARMQAYNNRQRITTVPTTPGATKAITSPNINAEETSGPQILDNTPNVGVQNKQKRLPRWIAIPLGLLLAMITFFFVANSLVLVVDPNTQQTLLTVLLQTAVFAGGIWALYLSLRLVFVNPKKTPSLITPTSFHMAASAMVAISLLTIATPSFWETPIIRSIILLVYVGIAYLLWQVETYWPLDYQHKADVNHSSGGRLANNPASPNAIIQAKYSREVKVSDAPVILPAVSQLNTHQEKPEYPPEPYETPFAGIELRRFCDHSKLEMLCKQCDDEVAMMLSMAATGLEDPELLINDDEDDDDVPHAKRHRHYHKDCEQCGITMLIGCMQAQRVTLSYEGAKYEKHRDHENYHAKCMYCNFELSLLDTYNVLKDNPLIAKSNNLLCSNNDMTDLLIKGLAVYGVVSLF